MIKTPSEESPFFWSQVFRSSLIFCPYREWSSAKVCCLRTGGLLVPDSLSDPLKGLCLWRGGTAGGFAGFTPLHVDDEAFSLSISAGVSIKSVKLLQGRVCTVHTHEFINLFLQLGYHQLHVIVAGARQGFHPLLHCLLALGTKNKRTVTGSVKHDFETVGILIVGQLCGWKKADSNWWFNIICNYNYQQCSLLWWRHRPVPCHSSSQSSRGDCLSRRTTSSEILYWQPPSYSASLPCPRANYRHLQWQ